MEFHLFCPDSSEKFASGGHCCHCSCVRQCSCLVVSVWLQSVACCAVGELFSQDRANMVDFLTWLLRQIWYRFYTTETVGGTWAWQLSSRITNSNKKTNAGGSRKLRRAAQPASHFSSGDICVVLSHHSPLPSLLSQTSEQDRSKRSFCGLPFYHNETNIAHQP